MAHCSNYENANWDYIKAFLALYRDHDYQSAAENLGIDASTLRRKIQSLEGALGYSLFVRENNQWVLAPGAEGIRDAALEMELATRKFFGLTPGNKEANIKISLPYSLSAMFSEVFSEFRQLYPGFRLNISSDARFVNLEREGFDFALRLARPVDNMSNIKIRKLGTYGLGVYGADIYVKEVVSKYGEEALFEKYDLIETSIDFSYKTHEFVFGYISWDQLGFSGQPRLFFDDLETCAKFSADHGGLAILPRFLAHRYPQLICVKDAPKDLVSELWLVSRLDMKSDWQIALAEMLSVKARGLEEI